LHFINYTEHICFIGTNVVFIYSGSSINAEDTDSIIDFPLKQDDTSKLHKSIRRPNTSSESIGYDSQMYTRNRFRTSSRSPNASATTESPKHSNPFESSFDVGKEKKYVEFKVTENRSMASNGDYNHGGFRRISTFSMAVENLLQGHTKTALEFLDISCQIENNSTKKGKDSQPSIELKETRKIDNLPLKASMLSEKSREFLKKLLSIFIPAKDEVFQLMETDPHRRFIAKRHATFQKGLNSSKAKKNVQ